MRDERSGTVTRIVGEHPPMRRRGWRTTAATASALLLAVALAAAPAEAEPAPKTIDVPALQKLVAGLGLEDTGDKTTDVVVTGQGSNGYTVSFLPSNDKSYVVVSTAWQTIPKDKLSMLPAMKLLEYNTTHVFGFSLGTDKDDSKFIILESHIDAPAVTPQSMRQYIDILVASADETAELWDLDKWTSANGAKAK